MSRSARGPAVGWVGSVVWGSRWAGTCIVGAGVPPCRGLLIDLVNEGVVVVGVRELLEEGAGYGYRHWWPMTELF